MKWLLILCFLLLLLAVGALLANRPPLFDPPGLLARLKLYLTTNVAQTRMDHAMPELRPLRFTVPEDELTESVLSAMRQLGWTEISEDNGVVRAIVTTRWLRFKDDIQVRLQRVENGLLVQVRSASRLGRGDFAANTRHILDLYQTLGEHVRNPAPNG